MKTKHKLARFAYYCTCGTSMVGSVNPSGLPKVQAMWDLQKHVGDGHAPTDAKGAAAARRKQDRADERARQTEDRS